MEERVKTSFIPKASLSAERLPTPAGNPIALVNLITGIILVLSILAAGGLFLFHGYTVQNIAAKKDSLERSRSAFEPATIKELVRLDQRIQTGQALLSSHVALSKLFDELEKKVLASVRFSDFSYEGEGAGRVVLSAHGEAASYNAIATQSGDFSKSDIITDPIFSGVNIGASGTINFDFSAVIDPSRVRYTPPSEAGSASQSAPDASAQPFQEPPAGQGAP